MKKYLFLFASFVFCSLSFSQPIWNFTDGSDCDPGYDKCWTASEDDFMTEHVLMLLRDTSLFKIHVDSVVFNCVSQEVDHGTPESILWVDENGLLRRSDISQIAIGYEQIIDSLGFIPYNATNPSSYITMSGARTAISLTTSGTSGTATYNNSTGVLNIPNYSTSFGTSTFITAGGRNFNQAYQISASVVSTISVSVQVSCNLSLSGGQAGNVQLQISPNGSTGWQTVAQLDASNTGTLTIGLNTTQTSGGQLYYEGIPAGYYWRVLTTNTTGTPTYTFNGGYEKTF
jgi:hypothetical protein